MNYSKVLERLLSKNIISSSHAELINHELTSRPFSVHHELRFILYTGILLLSSGTGIIIYENIDTIGHQIIIGIIALLTASCFYYSFKNCLPFSWNQTLNTNKLSGYLLLLGCSLFLILEGYIQYQYNVFGSKYGLAVLIPTVIFFYCAYRLDHAGVLSMAITGLASWLGLTIAPFSIISQNDFTDLSLIHSAIVLGFSLVIFGQVSISHNLKKHFSFTYQFLGGNLAAIASITGIFNHDYKFVYFLTGGLLSAYFILSARKNQSAIFLLMGVIYGYIILTYSFFNFLDNSVAGFIAMYYFLFSSIGVIFFLLNFKKILGIKK
ncbi:DUF2157 domain-containing protein [Dyadobacter psychrotolerans]|uniref:DUF2157 domain-containing protein n=1 Tax=Dyadobacter psychrotolerans TaxID=2541721 RepID=A0A4R5DSJ2_9BACT|nr:DUF2157 domain-containing protein [Dyadobacter psychrotolerans]TDE17402.1 DUF2157 domain-containing protein [Dyadobacter psychrotolerans]